MHRLGSQDPYMGTNLPLESFFFLNLISVMLFGIKFCSASGILQDDHGCQYRGLKGCLHKKLQYKPCPFMSKARVNVVALK